MNYRRTHLYNKALELVRTTHSIIRTLPVGYGFLADQLRRASASIVLNFAEGCGKSSLAERRRYLVIARGSAYEVAAAIDVAAALGAATAPACAEALELCDHVCAMLTRFGAGTRRP